MYHAFNIQNFTFCTQSAIFRINSDCFPVQRYLISFDNQDIVCLLRGTTDSIAKFHVKFFFQIYTFFKPSKKSPDRPIE
jgi:hypothetical protein